MNTMEKDHVKYFKITRDGIKSKIVIIERLVERNQFCAIAACLRDIITTEVNAAEELCGIRDDLDHKQDHQGTKMTQPEFF